MAELGNENPAGNPSQDGSQEVGERTGSLETQLSELATLSSSQQDLLKSLVEMQQGKDVESSGSERVAPRDTGLEAGAHQSGPPPGPREVWAAMPKALACPACGLGAGVLAQA